MKRGTPQHPKTHEFAALLGIKHVTALGHLELLFHFTAQYAPEGNIGRYSDKRIAAGLEWTGSPQRLIDSLVAAGWVDRCTSARLVVHDWCDHADRSVLQRLARHGKKPIQRIQQDTEKLCTQSETKNRTLPEPVPTECLLNAHTQPEPEPEPEPSSAENAEDTFTLTPTNNRPKNFNPFAFTDRWFDTEFWPRVWRKKSKEAARKAVRAKVKSQETRNAILVALEWQVPMFLARDPEHRPYPATWINSAGWEDEPDAETHRPNIMDQIEVPE